MYCPRHLVSSPQLPTTPFSLQPRHTPGHRQPAPRAPASKKKILKISTQSTYNLGWYSCAPLLSLTHTPRDPSHSFTNQEQPNQKYSEVKATSLPDEEIMILFRRSAGSAVYQAVIGFDSVQTVSRSKVQYSHWLH